MEYSKKNLNNKKEEEKESYLALFAKSSLISYLLGVQTSGMLPQLKVKAESYTVPFACWVGHFPRAIPVSHG